MFTTTPQTAMELDFIQFVLGFDRMEVGINASGTWVVNYRAKCRHLLPNLKCELHATPLKPRVCQGYNEHKCLYRNAFLGPPQEDYLRLDLRRFRAIRGLVAFDGTGRVLEVPPREQLFAVALAADAEVEPSAPTLPIHVPLKRFEQGVRWHARAARPTGVLPWPDAIQRRWAEVTESPCERCAAPCCQVLVFDFGRPSNANAVDFMEYMLGFDGVELALTDQGWKTLLRTSCRFFDQDTTRCRLFGHPERPLTCSGYDAHKCAYHAWLMEPLRRPFMRVDHDAFQVVRRHFPIDGEGAVQVELSLDQLSAILDATGVAPPRLASPEPPAEHTRSDAQE